MELIYQDYDNNTVKMSMTFQQYDDNVEKMKEMETRTIWPTPTQMELFEQDPQKWIFFLIYIYEYGISPKNKEEEYSRRSVNLFLQEHLLLIDEDEVVSSQRADCDLENEKTELSSGFDEKEE